MNTLLRVVISFPALLFIVTGLRWVTDPSEAAAGLGMILLDGVGRGAQIGDVGALFFTMGVMILLAQVTAKRTWFYAPALMLYGCLIEAFKYLKGPAEMLQIYNQSYEMTLQEVAAQQMGRGRRDEHQSGVIRMPRPSFLPGYSKPGPSGPIEGEQ